MNLKYIIRNKLCCLATAILLMFVLPGKAQVVDKIIAKVDNQIVLKSELEKAFLEFSRQDQTMFSKDNATCGVLETLIINKLLLAKAEIDSVTADKEAVDSELERRMDYMIAQAGGDSRKIEEFFGKSLDQLKTELRKMVKEQIIIQKMQEQISGKVKVTPGEVKKFFNEIPRDSLPYFSTEIEVGQIVIVPKITREQKLEAKLKAEQIRERIMNGEDFCKLAQEYSEDIGSASLCGELGYFKKGDLVTSYEAAALGLKPGETSAVTESEYGYHIIQLIDRRGNEFNTRHILLKPTSSQIDLDSAYHFLQKLRTNILNDSIAFEKAAYDLSDDKETKASGGLFMDRESGSTKIPLENIDPSIFFIIDTMQVGEISQPLTYRMNEETNAVRIIYYKSKTPPHQANLKDDYQKIYKAALNEKKEHAVHKWFDNTKNEVYIDIDPEYSNCNILATQ